MKMSIPSVANRAATSVDTIVQLINRGRRVAKSADPYRVAKNPVAAVKRDAKVILTWFQGQSDSKSSRRAFRKILRIQNGPRH